MAHLPLFYRLHVRFSLLKVLLNRLITLLCVDRLLVANSLSSFSLQMIVSIIIIPLLFSKVGISHRKKS